MAPFRYPGPICQTKDWFEEFDEGTLARTWSYPPSPIGTPAPTATQQAAPPVVATGDCAYLNPVSSGTVSASQQAFDRLRGNSGPASISKPQPIKSHAWPYGSPSPAVEHQVTIGSQNVTVILPTEAESGGKNLPTIKQVAEALRAIPAVQRAHTTRVIVCPRAHSGSTATKTVAGEGGSGEITLFPMSRKQTQNDYDNRLVHESGHNVQGSSWKSSQDVNDWKDAATKDNRLPSPYAGENAGDDFCEFSILFNAARGTPCEAVARQLYPHRWAKMLTYKV